MSHGRHTKKTRNRETGYSLQTLRPFRADGTKVITEPALMVGADLSVRPARKALP